MTLDLNEIIEASTMENFKKNLQKAVHLNVIEEERLIVYQRIALQLYKYDEFRTYSLDAWDLGLEEINHPSLDNITRADFLKTYGLVEMELNQFDLATYYLHLAEEILENEDQNILIDIYFGLSNSYKYLTELSKAMTYANKALQMAEVLDDNFEMSRAYLNIGNLFSKNNQYPQAQNAYEKALTYTNTKEVKANIFMSLGLLYKNVLNYPKAEEFFKKAEELFIELNFDNEIFELYVNYGSLYSQLAQFDKADEYLQQAKAYFEKINDSYNHLSCLVNLGRVAQSRANFANALEYFNQAITICEQDANLKSMGSLLYYSRANVFQTLKEYEKALSDYDIATVHATDDNDRAMEASIKNGIAGIIANHGEIEKAAKIYQEIIVIFEEDNNLEEIVATYTNIALLYDSQGMFELAHKAHTKALELAQSAQMPSLEISVLINMAELFTSISNTEEAIRLYNQAFTLLEVYDNDDLLSKCYLNLANIYESISKFDWAVKYAKLALELKEELKQEKSLYIIYNALACAYDGLKEVDEAEHYYQKALHSAKELNLDNYYGMLVNYGLFLFNLKKDVNGALACYDASKSYFEKSSNYETLIAINSNYAMIYKAQKEFNQAIAHYKKALEYADIFLSFIEDEEIMLRYRVNFEHIFDDLIDLNLMLNNETEAFYYLEHLKSRTLSKIITSKYFESTKIPFALLKKEKKLKSQLEAILSDDSDIVNLHNNIQKLHQTLNTLYQEMNFYDERYVLLKKNTVLNVQNIKGYL